MALGFGTPAYQILTNRGNKNSKTFRVKYASLSTRAAYQKQLLEV
jgi:hypothetical protein